MKRRLVQSLPLIRSWLAYAALPASALLSAPALARALGPEGRGQLAGVLQPMTLASAVAALGVPSAVTYFIGQQVAPARVSSLAVRISIATTLAVAACLWVYSGSVAHKISFDQVALLAVWSAFLPSAFISIRRSHLQGVRQYAALDFERVVGAALRVAFVLILWLCGVRAVAIYAAAYMVAGLSASLLLRLPDRSASTAPTPVELAAGRFTKYALLASFGTIATAMNARLDQAIMPAVVAPYELGYYSVAVAVAETVNIITTVLVRNVLAESSAGVEPRVIVRSVLLGGAGQLAMSLLLAICVPYAVPIVFGASFGPAVTLVRVLLLGSFVGYGGAVASAYLAGIGRPGFASIGPAVGAASTALLFWLRWDHMNAEAAAWITVIAQAATLIAGLVLTLYVAAAGRQRRAHTVRLPEPS